MAFHRNLPCRFLLNARSVLIWIPICFKLLVSKHFNHNQISVTIKPNIKLILSALLMMLFDLKRCHTEQYWLHFWGVLSATSSEVPKAQLQWISNLSILSRFILLISFSYQSDTGMLFNLHNRPSSVCMLGGALKKILKFYPAHDPFHNPPKNLKPPISKLSWPKMFLLRPISARESLSMPKPFSLLTWTWSKEGSLGLSRSLAWNSWTSWFQRGGKSGRGGVLLWLASNTHSWCLSLASLITSSVQDITGESHIYYPVLSRERDGNITTTASATIYMFRVSECV